MEVQVRGNLDRALRDLGRKLGREGWYNDIERHSCYLKPGERRKRKRRRAEERRIRRTLRRAR
ncbi:MAG: 30S ribosomal protein S21 [Candidatus Binataceae bacterium]